MSPPPARHVRNVLMTADAVGGVWGYSITLAKGLCRRGIRVTLATMGPHPSGEQMAAIRDIAGLELVESHYRLEWMENPWSDVDRAGQWLLALERDKRPDVVHLNGYCHADLPFHAPVVVVAHSCVTSWWDAVLREPLPSRFETYRRRVRRGLFVADVVVAPTRAMLENIRRLYAPGCPSLVIANGIEAGEWYSAEKQNVILAAGRVWDRAKNLSILIEAASCLRWPLRIAGERADPNWPSALTRYTTMLGQLSREALAEEMSRAAVFAHPALYEPFGLAPLEAAASGCVLVLGDIPSLREVWGDAAVFVDPRDPSAWIRTLSRLGTDGELRGSMARKARARAERLTAERTTRRYKALYEILARRRSTIPTQPSLLGAQGLSGRPATAVTMSGGQR